MIPALYYVKKERKHMVYLVFCLTDGKFRDVRNEFELRAEKEFVGRPTSEVLLKEKMPLRFWEKMSSAKMKLLMSLRGETHLLDPERILYLEINGRILRAHLDGSEEVCETYAQLKDVEEMLEKIGFLRISRFYIVAVCHITAIQGGEVRLSSGERFRIGRSYREKLKIVLVEKNMRPGK